ncbi:MAG: hypothetical protein WBM24_19335 [Candidatus Sulfotelmatobacter sp.]
MSVINSTTNGKKDNIALAATENAKVCTSVRSRYFIVEAVIPEGRLRRSKGGDGVALRSVTNGLATGVVVCSGMAVQANPIKGLARRRHFVANQSSGRGTGFPYTSLKESKTGGLPFFTFPF